MAKVTVTESSLENIADAIRAKLGVQTEYKPGEMAAAIQSLPTGGSAVLEHLSVTQNGTYTPGAGLDGFDQVTVNVSGGGGVPLLTRAQWDALTTQEKQAYGLVAISKTPELPQGNCAMMYVSMLISWSLGAVITLVVYRMGKWKAKANLVAG